MLQISFSLPAPSSPWWNTWESAKQRDVASLNELDLCYHYFEVDVEMVVGGAEIISSPRYLTLVDLALSLQGVMELIAIGKDAEFGFTESGEIIYLDLTGDVVSVSSSDHELQGTVDREELMQKLAEFLRVAHLRLVREVPELVDNPVIQRIARPLGLSSA